MTLAPDLPEVRTPLRMAPMRLVTPSDGAGSRRPAPPARTSLLALDRDFAAAVPLEDRSLGEAILHFPTVDLQPGPWPGPSTVEGVQALIVAHGLLSRTVSLGGRSTPELFGPGDVIDGAEAADGRADDDVGWAVQQPARLVVLDERFVLATRRWPALWQVLLQRGTARASRLAAQLAAMQLSRVEDRVERVLWQFADRWGRVTPEGVVVPVTLTHEALGRIVGAKRPTVSLALTVLSEAGRVDRRSDGTWLLLPRG